MVCPHCGGTMSSFGLFGVFCQNPQCQGGGVPAAKSNPGAKPTGPGPWSCKYCRGVNPGNVDTCGVPGCKFPNEVQVFGNRKLATQEALKVRVSCCECHKTLSSYLDAYHGTNPEAAMHCGDCRYRKKLK